MKQRFSLLLIVLAAAVSIAAASAVQAFYIGVSPVRFELELTERPITESIKLFNRSSDPVEVTISVANWDLDEKNQVREIAPTENSLDQWIVIRPNRLVIPPGETRAVRFAIRPYVRPNQGEYRALLYIAQQKQLDPNLNAMQTKFRLGLAVYAHAGEKIVRAKLHGLTGGGAGPGLDIENTGNSHVRFEGKYGLWPASEYPGDDKARAAIAAAENAMPAGALAGGIWPNTPVLPGTRRTVVAPTTPPLKPGTYRAFVSGNLGSNSLSTSQSFTVEPATQ